ncbi:DUF1566 domain-containing protein [Paraburkholderia sp. MM5384-R2]|uniref:Lcl C-terminal domain-containing protein n=1 Tax=Paraburkholderia sp. MM5384-R2 TaxID=2723097 RepID=UPI0039067CDE
MKSVSRTLKIVSTFLLAPLISTYSYSACHEKIRPALDVKGDLALDHNSGLIWQRCALGTRWNNRTKQCDGKVNGLTRNEALVVARRSGSEWRVPSATELASLRINTCRGPKIDTRVFPNVTSSDLGEGMNFWTSTRAISPDTFYYLNFADGSFDFHSEGFKLAVILVRDKQIRFAK